MADISHENLAFVVAFAGYDRGISDEALAIRHPTDLAGLRGARLVSAIETEEGRRWAEAKIKALTGGDKISARFMRQDFFEFQPQLKLIIAGNHKPSLRSVDEVSGGGFTSSPSPSPSRPMNATST